MRATPLFLLAIVAASCASSQSVPSASTAPQAPIEDFSKYRPSFPEPPAPTAAAPVAAKPNITPTHHINARLHPILDSIAENNKKILYAQGYRVLAYSGNEREEAMGLRKKLLYRLPDEPEYFTYTTPTFKLKFGDYLTRLEAQATLNRIKGVAPRAMIITDQIVINKQPGSKKENR